MRLKMFNGAPLCAQLDFGADALLDPMDCDNEHSHFLRGVVATRSACEEDQPSTQAKWRYLADTSTRLRTGWSQPYLPGGGIYEGDSNFSFTVPNLERSFDYVEQNTRFDDTTNTLDDTTIDVDNFLQHSLMLHDTLLSSQIALDSGADNTITSSSFFSTSFASVTTEAGSPVKGESIPTITNLPSALNITALTSLPNAQLIRSIYPQTPTRNFVCVLTSQPEHREVIVRKGGYRMHIYEITVADDTKVGFKVSFWFRPPKQDARAQDCGQDSLRDTLQRSKVGDILLLRNVVLNVFRDDVYGQSLNPSITRARTTLEVLKRGDGFSAVNLSALPTTVAETFVRVKRWANVHVAADSANSRKRKGSIKKKKQPAKRNFSSDLNNETLPPDTMEA
jgi:hypothetical protein